MKVLILSSNIGGGHNSCAKAVCDYFCAKGEECTIEDSVRFISKRVSSLLSKWHTRVYRYMPKAFTCGYNYLEKNPDLLQKHRSLSKPLNSGNEKLYKYITENKYDVIISTHLIPAIMVTEIVKKHNISVATSFIHTDYTCYPITAESSPDYFFIADESLRGEFTKIGINDKNVISSGIPVRNEFYDRISGEQAKAMFGIRPEQKHIIVMGGSMGCGPVEKIVSSLSDKSDCSYVISVICGTNKNLAERLSEKYNGNENMHIYGYCDDVHTLMDSADLCLIKPGGISVTEAYVKKVPMVLMNTISGCEEYNKNFFTQNGCAVASADAEELTALCYELLKDDDKLSAMKRSFPEERVANASEIIYNTFLQSHISIDDCKNEY